MTGTPVSGALPPSALMPYANARILLFSTSPWRLDSERTGCFLFEGFIKRLRGISSKVNAPGSTPATSPTSATSLVGGGAAADALPTLGLAGCSHSLVHQRHPARIGVAGSAG